MPPKKEVTALDRIQKGMSQAYEIVAEYGKVI